MKRRHLCTYGGNEFVVEFGFDPIMRYLGKGYGQHRHIFTRPYHGIREVCVASVHPRLGKLCIGFGRYGSLEIVDIPDPRRAFIASIIVFVQDEDYFQSICRA